MGEVVIVTGIPGTGKTTVLDGALQHTKGWKVVNYGSLMFEVAQQKKIAKHRDELRKLPQKKQIELQEMAAKKISEMAKKDNILIDTHNTIKTPRGFLPGIKRFMLDAVNPSLIINVESFPKEIYGRRHKDDSRERDEESAEQIHDHQMINRTFSASYCSYSGATFAIVENHDNQLKDAIRQMKDVLETK